ncbi:class I SAM-dependent methyltransferase [Candidatus Woesearchaeota archaeon]|nr:class I SAM-dependent methyltransferase [Candidatus Woesearchaeota archaeon]
MNELPASDIYEQEFKYMPWGTLIERVLDLISTTVPRNGSALDLMCGPGYLLGKIRERRRDMFLEGIDISKEFIGHAIGRYPTIKFGVADVMGWNSTRGYDLVTCTGGIHHLPYEQQARFLEKVKGLLKPNGLGILADPYIDHYESEEERKLGAARLGYEYLAATMRNGAPPAIVKAAIDILDNDVRGKEFKTSIRRMKPIMGSVFSSLEVHKTWPETDSDYGEYYLVVRK